MKRLFVMLVLMLLGNAVEAQEAQETQAAPEVRYVSDRLSVTFRVDRGLTSRLIGLLDSGTRLEVLELDPAGEVTKVRTADGKDGWVQTRYLDTQAAARERIAPLEKELAEARAAAQTEITQLKTRNTQLQQALQAAQAPRPAEAAKAERAAVHPALIGLLALVAGGLLGWFGRGFFAKSGA